MTCAEVRKLIPEGALGDLDAEPAAELSAHLRQCAACRADSESLGRTVSLLRTAPALPPSTERRSAAVAAMARAHAEQSERLLARPRISWVPWATAAAFLLALLGALTVRTGGSAFTVARVDGAVEVRDRETGLWRRLSPGEAVSVGDRLVTQPGSLLLLTSSAGDLCLDKETSVEVVGPRRVTLDRGRLLAIAPESAQGGLVVTDTANNSATVLEGRVELGLRDAVGEILGYTVEKGRPANVPESKKEVRRRLTARVDRGEVALGGSKDQRLRASGGREGTFSFDGQPSTSALSGDVGTWAAPLLDERK